MKLKNSNGDKTQELKLWQLKNSNCDIVQKLKLWQNLNYEKPQFMEKNLFKGFFSKNIRQL